MQKLHEFVCECVFTSMVCDWCIDLMADWAICLAVNVTKAQPVDTDLTSMKDHKRTPTLVFKP